MRRRLCFLGRALCLAAVCLPATFGSLRAADKQPREQPSRATLIVDVLQLRNDEGRVAVAVFNTEEAFPDQERALRGKLSKISGKRARVTFKGLKPGTYAVAVLHDENENDEMDFNFVGMPLEGYGFSNDASAMFGPPSFEDAAFRLRGGRAKARIKARYFL